MTDPLDPLDPMSATSPQSPSEPVEPAPEANLTSEPTADMPSAPLLNLFDWQKRAVGAGLLVIVISALVMFQNVAGWGQLVLVLLIAGGAYAAWSWFKAQHTLQVAGDVLRISRPGKLTEIHGRDVTAVKYVMNRESPDFTLVTTSGRHTVRTSRLDKGHSTLFGWLQQQAPQAQLDKRSVRIREMLEIRGLLPE